MKPEPSTIALRWPGTDTLKDARAAIRSGTAVDIELPLEVHYALEQRLKNIDVTGGPELLAPVASVAGLQDLRELEPVLRKASYRVHVTTPVPRLRLTPPNS
jgi:hypothetical protein